MSRPYVKLNVKNEIASLIDHLDRTVPKWKEIEGVEGITLNGGLSRGFGDHLSEIDVTLFLNTDTLSQWKHGKAPIPEGIVKFDKVLYDIKFANIEEELSRSYEDVALWDMSYAKILYDPMGKLDQLFQRKMSIETDIDQSGGFLWSAYWHFKLAGNTWIHREDPLQGHLMLNEAIIPLVKALFVANKEYIPHEKWLIHMSYTLSWTPSNWMEKLTNAMNPRNFTVESLIRRQSEIQSLYDEIDQYIRKNYYDHFELACHQKWFYDLLKILDDRGSIPVEEWCQMAGITDLNAEPLYQITDIKEGKVLLNHEKLLALTEDDMYIWHYEIVRKIQNERLNG